MIQTRSPIRLSGTPGPTASDHACAVESVGMKGTERAPPVQPERFFVS